MKEREKRIQWIGWIYAVVLVLFAVAGIIYCSRLNNASDAANTPEYYAVQEHDSEDSVVLSENADMDETDSEDGIDIIDLGGTSADVPLGDAIIE